MWLDVNSSMMVMAVRMAKWWDVLGAMALLIHASMWPRGRLNPYVFPLAILISKGVQFALASLDLGSLHSQLDDCWEMWSGLGELRCGRTSRLVLLQDVSEVDRASKGGDRGGGISSGSKRVIPSNTCKP